MKAIVLSVVYLLIATSAVKSASYHRIRRELVSPLAEEPLKEVIAELKKESPVGVEEVQAEKLSENVVADSVSSANVKAVEQLGVESVVPQVAAVVTDEARSEDSPALRLDKLEVVPANVVEPAKVATVAETVKQVAIEAIRTTNEEAVVPPGPAEVPAEQKTAEVADTVAIKAIPADVPVVENAVVPEVKTVEAPAVEEVRNMADVVSTQTVGVESVENAEPVVKSLPEPVAEVKVDTPAVVQTVAEVAESVEAKNVVPAAIIKETVPTVAEDSLVAVKQLEDVDRPAVVDKVKTDSADDKVDAVPQSVEQQVKAVEGIVDAEKDPNVRQSPPSLTSIAQGFINALGNLIPPLANQQQAAQEGSSASAEPAQQPAEEALATGEVAPNGVASSTAQPNIIQSAWNSITNILQRTTTVAPAAAASSDTRKDDNTVEIVQNIEVENVNDKLDLNKKATV